jgi:hypothetical protein
MLGARIAEQASCAIHLVHHTRKAPAGTEVTSGEPRRSPTRRAWCALNQMTEEDGAKAGVENHRLFFFSSPGPGCPVAEVGRGSRRPPGGCWMFKPMRRRAWLMIPTRRVSAEYIRISSSGLAARCAVGAG